MSVQRTCSFDMDPNNHGGVNAMDSSMDASSGYEQPPKKKRIRAKLDHLSPNEKLQRRKMKNRIAAQTARDRKRAKIDYLEEENRKLRMENEALKLQLHQEPSGTANQPNIVIDSGISDNDSAPKTSASASMVDCAEVDHLGVPVRSATGGPAAHAAAAAVSAPIRTNQFPSSPDGSSTSGAYSSSPMPEIGEYLDCAVGEIDESLLINDILQLQESLFSEQAGTGSVIPVTIGGELSWVDVNSIDVTFDHLEDPPYLLMEDQLLCDEPRAYKL